MTCARQSVSFVRPFVLGRRIVLRVARFRRRLGRNDF
jgi:hypothetical protein